MLDVNPTSGSYKGTTTDVRHARSTPTPTSRFPNETVTLTLNGTQTCTATTNASGVATCSITPNEPAGTYSLTASFAGDNTSMPQLTSSSSLEHVHRDTGADHLHVHRHTSVTNGSSATLSGVLTTSQPTPGTDVVGPDRDLHPGFGGAAQSCTTVTNANGAASCAIAGVNQTTGTTGISATFGGDTYYHSSTASSTAIVYTPTKLTVSAGTSDFADAGTGLGDADQRGDRRADPG